jgi:hypothetical protein
MNAAAATGGGVSRAELARLAGTFPARRVLTAGGAAALAGAAAFIWGLAAHPDRTWWAYHVSVVFWMAVAQGMVVFAAIQKLVHGRWSGFLTRFAEAAVGFQIVALVLYLGMVLGREHIFPWLHEPRPELGGWLTARWFFPRNAVVLALLAWLSWRFVRRDLAPDLRELADGRPADPDAAEDTRLTRDAALLVVGFAFGYTLLGYDLMMSLAHKWVSNLFGAFYFIGGFLGALGLLAALTVVWRPAMGLGELISPRQLHDIGKLVFGFTVFWTYLMWSQFLVIWYGNLPEETWFVFYRLYGAWKPVGVTVFALVFLAPFAGLLFAKTKQFPPTLLGFALVSLTGLWLERYLEIVPSVNRGAGPAIGVPEVGLLVFVGGLFFLAYGWFATRYPMVSPRLAAETIAREHH